MLKNLAAAYNKFHEDQALIFLTFGGFGRYVLSILDDEFRRLGIPENKVSFLAFDTEEPHRDHLDLEREAEYFVHLEEFDGDIYIANKENEELLRAVNHVPSSLLSDIQAGCKGVPAVGFVSFHKYDELLITKHAFRAIDDVRSKNPGKKIKLIVISGMAGSVSNGMTVPFLYRIRERLKEKKIRVEVFLATSEVYIGLQNIMEDGIERNCVASAMLWEYALRGGNGLVYPGKHGLRNNEMFNGKIAHRAYIFSGGSAETSLKYQSLASTIATCISTLEITKVGSYLDGDRVNYAPHILEREWKGRNGNRHPTSLLTMNVAGLKGDCFPQIFHLHAVKRFVEDLVKSPTRQDEERIKGKATSSFLENNLNEDDILNLFKIQIATLTAEIINQESVSAENISKFLREKIAEIHQNTDEEFEKKKKLEEVSWFIERVIGNFSQKSDGIILSSDNYLKGGLLFYEKLISILDEKITSITESISRIESELFEGTNQKTLNNLLDKLETVTKKKSGIKEFVVNLGKSSTVSLVNQIIDVSSKIYQQKKDKYDHLLLQRIYSDLLKFCEEQEGILKSAIYKYNVLLAQIDRETENIIRIGRSSFTYNKSKFDELTEHLSEEILSKFDIYYTPEVIAKLGGPILKNKTLDTNELLDELLGIIQIDQTQLTQFIDNVFCVDPMVYEYLETILSQFFMTLKLDRDRFPTLETSDARFVMCTRNFYDRYKDELFEGYTHLETNNPFNILVTQHVEGFPFISMSYMHRINERFKELHEDGKSSHGHIMACLDEQLPFLDS